MVGNNFTQNKKNEYLHDWHGLTLGKLMCIHDMALQYAKAGHPLAHDIVHEIDAFQYGNPDLQLMLESHTHDKMTGEFVILPRT
jgi:hypothetical protein